LQIVMILSQGEQAVGALSTRLGQNQPAVSHHLALLRHGGIIAPRRQGKHNFYSLTESGANLAKVLCGTFLQPESFERTIEEGSLRPILSTFLEEVRGLVDDPEGWFRTPNPVFEGRRPIDLLGTPDEARLRNRIEAAKLGMFS
jgi:DNA-binding transcriptional ArsR family regulator